MSVRVIWVIRFGIQSGPSSGQGGQRGPGGEGCQGCKGGLVGQGGRRGPGTCSRRFK